MAGPGQILLRPNVQASLGEVPVRAAIPVHLEGKRAAFGQLAWAVGDGADFESELEDLWVDISARELLFESVAKFVPSPV